MAVNITIDDILTQLENIIAGSIKSGDRLGYFAALYYKVTASVKEGIARGQFENGARMEKFDVIFACRYLDAYNAWKSKKSLTSSWQVAFEAALNSSDLVLQHLLLGMNAHINLDLGIAAVSVTGGQIESIQNDFNAINTIISALTYEVLNDLDRVSPLLSLLGLHASEQTSVLIQFSIDNARDGAWCFAEDLAKKTGSDYDDCIAQRDKTIARLAKGIVETKGFMRFTIWLIHLFEWENAGRIIKTLHQSAKQKIVINHV